MTLPSPPRSFPAGEREAIVRCPPCGQPIVTGELVASCPACGTVHHTGCWTQNGGCGTYACAPARRETSALASGPAGAGVMRVTADDIARAPVRAPAGVAEHGAALSRAAWSAEKNAPIRWNRVCLAAFIAALVSIPAFGMFTGWIAVIIGIVGLVARKPRERGLALGIGGILIGIASALTWTVLYLPDWQHSGGGVQLFARENQDIDPQALADLPEHLGRPMRSNVLITNRAGIGSSPSSGSGIVLKITGGSALILTNRHVVDSDFDGTGEADDAIPTDDCRVKFLGHARVRAKVVWIAPAGIDAALVQAAVSDAKDVEAACWEPKPHFLIGDKIFVVGNPLELGWSRASGEISQIRRESFGTHDIRIIQTDAAINHGHSGGGLYDQGGLLLGINTWTQDKRASEGLSFSIAFHSVLELIPKSFEIPAGRAPAKVADASASPPATPLTPPPGGMQNPSDPS